MRVDPIVAVRDERCDRWVFAAHQVARENSTSSDSGGGGHHEIDASLLFQLGEPGFKKSLHVRNGFKRSQGGLKFRPRISTLLAKLFKG